MIVSQDCAFPKPSILVQVKVGSPSLILFEMASRLPIFPANSCESFKHFPQLHSKLGGNLGETLFSKNFPSLIRIKKSISQFIEFLKLFSSLVGPLGRGMAKRFTDSKKWKDSWFRNLPLKAKITWNYLCDDCENSGIWKADYGMATFCLGFNLTEFLLKDWFGDRLYFFDRDKVLLVKFYEFQYSDSKDTWSAKVRAREALEGFGFKIVDGKVQVPQSPHSGGTSLSISIGKSIIEDKKEEVLKISDSDLEAVYQSYPRKEGKSEGLKKARAEIKTHDDLDRLIISIQRYNAHLKENRTEPKYILKFNNFMKSWRDWLDKDAGAVAIPAGPKLVKVDGAVRRTQELIKKMDEVEKDLPPAEVQHERVKSLLDQLEKRKKEKESESEPSPA